MAELDKVDKFAETIHKAMEIHVQNAIGALGFNKTEQAEIVDVTNAKAGDYVVSNGSTRYHAYSDDLNYTLGTKVYVLIPNNDYTQQKIILNKVKRTDETSLSYVSPLDGYSPKTFNLLENSNRNASMQEIKDIETILNFKKDNLYSDGDYVYYNGELYRCNSYSKVTFFTNDNKIDLDNWIKCLYIPDHLLIVTMLLDRERENLVVDQSLLKNYEDYKKYADEISEIRHFTDLNINNFLNEINEKYSLNEEQNNNQWEWDSLNELAQKNQAAIDKLHNFDLGCEEYLEKISQQDGNLKDTFYWELTNNFLKDEHIKVLEDLNNKFEICVNSLPDTEEQNILSPENDNDIKKFADWFLEERISAFDKFISERNKLMTCSYDQNIAKSLLANYCKTKINEEGKEEFLTGERSKIIYLSEDLSVANSSEENFNNNYKYMGFSAAFKTLFDPSVKVVYGDYGVDVVILYSKQIQDKAQDRKYETVTYRISTSDMIGNIYNFTTEHIQEALFKLETDEKSNTLIHRIMIIAYQNGEFKAVNTKSGDRTTFYLDYSKEEQGKEVLLDDNIFISKISVKLGDEIDQSNLYDQVQIYTEDGSFYDSAEKVLVEKQINIKWTHTDPLTGVSNELTRVPKNISNQIANSVPTISWYQDEFNGSGEYRSNIEKVSKKYDELKNIIDDYDEFYEENYRWISEWEKYADEEDNIEDAWNRFLNDNGYKVADFQEKVSAMNESIKKIIIAFGLKPSKHYYYDPVNKALILTAAGRKTATSKITRNSKSSKAYLKVDETLAGEGWVPIELNSKENAMSINYTPRANSNTCKLKCVIQYGPQIEKDGEMVYDTASPYYHKISSNELVFTNLTKVVDLETWSVTSGLTFNFLDKSNGFYPLYNYTGSMIDPSNANKIRKLEVNAVTSLFGDSYIDGNEIIIWKLPKENTMLEFERKVDDPDEVKKDIVTEVFDTTKTDYKEKDKVICRYKKNEDGSIKILNINDGVINNKGILTEYFICIKDYPSGSNVTQINPFDENNLYWTRYNLEPEERIIYPPHRISNLTKDEVNELLNPHNVTYDDGYYYVKYEANESNNIIKELRDVTDKDGKTVYNEDGTVKKEEFSITIPARNYIKYKLKSLYKPYFYNNTVTCYIIKNIADGFFTGNAQITFGNKDNNGTDYTLVFYLGNLVTPKDEPIEEIGEGSDGPAHSTSYTIDHYIEDTELDGASNGSTSTSSKELTNSLVRPNVIVTKDWEIVGGPEEAISLDSPYYQEIVFKVLDNDGVEINLTQEQKNNIIRMWTNTIEEGYYTGFQNAKNLNFLCKLVTETKINTITDQSDESVVTNKYYTDVAVKAKNAAEIEELEFIVLKLQINSKILNYDSTEDEEVSFGNTNKKYNLNNVNLTALLPLNFRKNDSYFVDGSNFINYSSSGSLNKSFSSNYVLNNGYVGDMVEDIKDKFNNVSKTIEDSYEKKEKIISALADIYDSLTAKATIPQTTEKDDEKDAEDPVDLEKLKEEETAILRSQVKENFPNLFLEIPLPKQSNQYYGISNLLEIQKNVNAQNEECATILGAIKSNETKLVLFKASKMSIWNKEHFNAIRQQLVDFGAKFADDVNLGNDIDERYFRSEKNKARIKKKIDDAIKKNESDWNKLNKDYEKKVSEDKKKLSSKNADIEKQYKKLIDYNNNIGSFKPEDFNSANPWLSNSEITEPKGELQKQLKQQCSQTEEDKNKLAKTARDTLTASLVKYFKEFDTQYEKKIPANAVKAALNELNTVGVKWSYYPNSDGSPTPVDENHSGFWKKENMDFTDLKKIQEKILRFFDIDDNETGGKKYGDLTSEEKAELKKYINDFNSLKEKKIKEQNTIIKNANKIIEQQCKNIKPYTEFTNDSGYQIIENVLYKDGNSLGEYQIKNGLPTEETVRTLEKCVLYDKKEGIINHYTIIKKIMSFVAENIENRNKLLKIDKDGKSKITILIEERNVLNNSIQSAYNTMYGLIENTNTYQKKIDYEKQKNFLDDCLTLWSWNGIVPSTNLVKDIYIDNLKKAINDYMPILPKIIPIEKNVETESNDSMSSTDLKNISNFIQKVKYSSKDSLEELTEIKEGIQNWSDDHVSAIENWGLIYIEFWLIYKKLGTFDVLISQYDDTETPHRYVNILDKYHLDELKDEMNELSAALETALAQDPQDTEDITNKTNALNNKRKAYENTLTSKNKELQYYPNIMEDGHTLKAPSILASNIEKNISIIGYSELGEIIYIMPIIMLRSSNGQISAISKWDGQAIVDQDNNRIMSAVIAAGTKTSDNNFTGVVIGDIEKDGTQSDYDTPSINGIYGYHNGAQSFGIKTDGTSFLGKEGSGRIEFDGNKGTIKSGNYSETDHAGTCFDLDDGWLDVYNNKNDGTYFKTHIGKKDSNDPIFSIHAPWSKTVDNVTTKGVFELMHVSENKYYLQSAGYAKESGGLKIDLENGSFESNGVFTLTAAAGSTISFGSRAEAVDDETKSFFEIDANGKVTCKGINILDNNDQSILTSSGRIALADHALAADSANEALAIVFQNSTTGLKIKLIPELQTIVTGITVDSTPSQNSIDIGNNKYLHITTKSVYVLKQNS